MTGRRSSILEWASRKREQRRWSRVARDAPAMDIAQLRAERARARKVMAVLTEFLPVADDRLSLPATGSDAFPVPHGTDWSWRPDLWRVPLAVPGKAAVDSKTPLGADVTLFHDCEQSELTMRQVRNTRAADLAPFGLRLDVLRFDGSFLSIVLDLPAAALAGLTRNHLIRLDTRLELEKPLEIFARLNIRHGPNTEQFVREMPLHQDETMVEFDLAYGDLNEKRIESAWVDLIFENPEMSQVILRDLTFGRRPRAGF